MKLSFAELVAIFTGPRDDHPARKALARRKRMGGKIVSGDSKWHRRVEAAGLKGKC